MQRKMEGGIFHLKRFRKGYYCAETFCEIFPVIANTKVKRVIKGYR